MNNAFEEKGFIYIIDDIKFIYDLESFFDFYKVINAKALSERIGMQQFNILTMENGKENPIAKMLLQMLSIGAEMENNQRKIRQGEGIQLAKIKGIYKGCINGARTSPSTMSDEISECLRPYR